MCMRLFLVACAISLSVVAAAEPGGWSPEKGYCSRFQTSSGAHSGTPFAQTPLDSVTLCCGQADAYMAPLFNYFPGNSSCELLSESTGVVPHSDATRGSLASSRPVAWPAIPGPPEHGACFEQSVDVAAATGSDLSGAVAVVTGGDTGIGLGTVEALASVKATVIIAAYDLAHGNATAESVAEKFGNPHVRAMQIDLSSFASVRSFAAALLREFPVIDVLVNDAGIDLNPSGLAPLTKDGFERVFQVNYLGPFLLTQLLLPALRTSGRAGGGRVINVASSYSYVNCEVRADRGNAPHSNRSAAPSAEGHACARALDTSWSVVLCRIYPKESVKCPVTTPRLNLSGAITMHQGSLDTKPRRRHAARPGTQPKSNNLDNACFVASCRPATRRTAWPTRRSGPPSP